MNATEINEALALSRRALSAIGEGDWTPQDSAHARLQNAAEELLAELLIARGALDWIVGFCEGAEEAHTGFRHVRRQAQLGLGQEIQR
jgi:hypothetical protein